MSNEIIPSPAQQAIIDDILTDDCNLLITGVAGAGKSFAIKKALSAGIGNVAVVAPTGIAALNVGGCTIHKLIGWTPRLNLDSDPILKNYQRDLLSNIDVLVIDECSMLRADLLKYTDSCFRMAKREPDMPFGGCRIIMTGDYWQLPPVAVPREQNYLKRVHGSKVGWNVLAPVFEAADFKVHFLSESFRQGADAEFASILNDVRDKKTGAAKRLNAKVKTADQAPENTPWLCARNQSADNRNEQALRRVQGEQRILTPTVTGNVPAAYKAALEPVKVKIGARVLICRNSPARAEGASYVNGSLGTLRSYDETTNVWVGPGPEDFEEVDAIGIELDNGEMAYVPETVQEICEFVVGENEDTGEPEVQREVVATIKNYEIKLGWAMTIHKSQGQTLERAIIDLGAGAFAHGMTYVALSRMTTLDGVYLADPLEARDIIVDQTIVNFFKGR